MFGHCQTPIVLESRKGPADAYSSSAGLGVVIRADGSPECGVSCRLCGRFSDEVSYIEHLSLSEFVCYGADRFGHWCGLCF